MFFGFRWSDGAGFIERKRKVSFDVRTSAMRCEIGPNAGFNIRLSSKAFSRPFGGLMVVSHQFPSGNLPRHEHHRKMCVLASVGRYISFGPHVATYKDIKASIGPYKALG